ncbi:hypothetical protein [Tenacibaculum amylolyticum]|uniref:hypothetical protein n=1 Tax=Tenacibaculum amylolyticum TaxID=104269 RepID=UPI003894A47D
MKTTHNIKRYGELWPSYRVTLGLKILKKLKQWVIVSGGWAWHFMSEMNHKEFKHAHDHKDIDIFVNPKNVGVVMQTLLDEGFEKVWTRYDHMPSNENFRRYEKIEWLPTGKQVRVTIDFFESNTVESIQVNGWNVVKPEMLLSFYNNIHSSDACWAVKAVTKLLKTGENPVGNPLLSKIP